MPSKHATGTRSTVIRCPNCGEDYSVTYKRCPFCDEKTAAPRRQADEYEDDYEEEYDGGQGGEHRPRRSSGRRVSGGSARGGGGDWSPLRIVGTVVSLSIIVAALWIVVTQIVPLVRRGDNLNKDPNNTLPVTSQQVEASPAPTGTAGPEASGAPDATGAPDSTLTPEATTAPVVPADQTATGFTLNKSDFSMSDRYPEPIQLKVTFTPAGTTGTITWESSDPDVAAVDANGKVTRGTKSGQTTITATMAGGFKQECTVRGNYSESGGTTATSGGTAAGSLSLNRTDFTMYKAGETFGMKVSGTSSTPTWAIGNTSVATISGDGKVTAVGSGTTTVTCTVDGQKLECIVRVSIK